MEQKLVREIRTGVREAWTEGIEAWLTGATGIDGGVREPGGQSLGTMTVRFIGLAAGDGKACWGVEGRLLGASPGGQAQLGAEQSSGATSSRSRRKWRRVPLVGAGVVRCDGVTATFSMRMMTLVSV